MGGIIAVSVGNERRTWGVAGWVFGGYLDHVLSEVRGDTQLENTVHAGLIYNHLDLTKIGVDAARLGPVLLRIADEAVAGSWPVSVQGRVLDDHSQQQFRDSVAELRTILTAWWQSLSHHSAPKE